MAESQAPAAPGAPEKAGPNHGRRIFLIWIVLALVADLIIWFLWYPHLPPGRMTESAQHQQFDIAVLGLAAAPVMLFVWTYFGYTLINWRHRDGDDDDGPPLFGHTGIQATWIAGTAVIVLAAFVFGTVELIVPAGAGAGQGPNPVWKPSGSNYLQVQVIGQQWQFTYRYPQFGGMETTQLLLPDNRRDRVPRDLAGRDPQLLGLPARGESRRQPGCGQRRVHDHQATRRVHRPVLGAVRDLARRDVQLRPGGHPHGVPGLGHELPKPSERRQGMLAALPPYALAYDPTVIPQLAQGPGQVSGITGAAGYYYPPRTR